MPGYDAMLKLKSGAADYRLATNVVAPYTRSTDANLSKIAEAVSTCFNGLLEVMRES